MRVCPTFPSRFPYTQVYPYRGSIFDTFGSAAIRFRSASKLLERYLCTIFAPLPRYLSDTGTSWGMLIAKKRRDTCVIVS